MLHLVMPQVLKEEPIEYFKIFKHLDIKMLFICQTIERFSETNGIVDHIKKWLSVLSTPALAKAIRERIHQNPCQKKTLLAK